MIDLHIHSVHSDGSDTPAELVRQGAAIGLTGMALTDHDNMGGVTEFLDACREAKITGIAGIELSCDTGRVGGSTLHILGYGLDPDHPLVVEAIKKILDGRQWRNERILERLNTLGVELNWSEVQACSEEEIIGRVHIAQALVNRNAVSSLDDAFDRYLDIGRPAYVPRYKLYPEEGISIIHAAGGAAVAAHPFQWLPRTAQLAEGLRKLKALGLDGLEARYSSHSQEQTLSLLRLASELELFPTGGSDYHGIPKPDIRLGRGFSGLNVPDDYLVPLLAAVDAPNNPRVVLRP